MYIYIWLFAKCVLPQKQLVCPCTKPCTKPVGDPLYEILQMTLYASLYAYPQHDLVRTTCKRFLNHLQ